MLENGPPVPESVASPLPPPVERGNQRFSFKRALIGAAIGAVALPVFSIGSMILLTQSLPPEMEVVSVALVGLSQVTAGAVAGGILAGALLWR